MPGMWMEFWQWLGSLPASSASFLGTLTGSSLGLVALLLGALFNAHLNRKRDDRLRIKETRALAGALKAELVGKSRSLKDNTQRVQERKSHNVLVPDIAQSIHIMPKVVDKLGLLDEETIISVIEAYGVIEQYCERLIINGGVLVKDLPGDRRLISLDESFYKILIGGTLAMIETIEKAITKLDFYLR